MSSPEPSDSPTAQVLPITGTRETAPVPQPDAPPAKPQSKARIVFISLIVAAAAGATTRYAFTYGRESTDDAQVEGHIVNVAARVTGQVTKVLAQDNELVQAGALLVELDHDELKAKLEVTQADLASAKAQLASAQAQLALTERTTVAGVRQAQGGVTQASSSIDSSKAALTQAKADIAAFESRVHLTDLELQRVKTLRADNAVPEAELDSKQAAYDQAKAQLDQSKARYEATKAGIEAASGGLAFAEGRLAQADTVPQQIDTAKAAVDLAAARVKQTEAAMHVAELNLSYTYVKALTSGIVSRRTVEVGQLVSPERALLALVPNDVWIVANFKEDQIGAMKAGQKAEVEIDTFSSRTLSGHVDSIAGASGARFSLLPPDNASGNYVKVVQRVPVLIRLDDNTGVPLRPGMSAEVTVDTRTK